MKSGQRKRHSHQLIRKRSPTARNSRKATCGTRLGAPVIERVSRARREKMQPRSAAFSARIVGFCSTCRVYKVACVGPMPSSLMQAVVDIGL